ncbi:T9SS type A sorting domain-containing protein [Flammeovirga sp. SJP92]|uniref:T9SS type A sorting domain-containing protein n=1 Tax=Flammeovirga sp. SJP92 TaxID=1775430 RepID=UPI000787731D|nr:T9SS type A sorting domain-containing protein [Flammeovirga sp. SJP92]KXX68537.1 hypothetical protein AVL50_22505 [Flammeovirga sp. SJP92]
MVKIFITLLLVLPAQILLAQDDTYSEYLLAKLQKVQNNHSSHRAHHHDTRHCGTPLYLEAHRNWDRLNAKTQAAFSTSADRHTYDSPKVYESQYFTIHYTTTGSDAVDATDQNNNDIPDYIDLVATISDNVFKIDIQDRGFNAPPADSGLGGSDKPDIYIYNLETGVYGTVAPENNLGDNSATTIVEKASYTSHMNLRNNYEDFNGTEEENLKVTLAHELSHMIDFGYNYNFPTWFLEAKGAWEEKRIYPDLTDNFQYLTSLAKPDYALNYGEYNIDNESDEASRWYSGWLFFQLVYENLEDQTYPFFRKILERGVVYTSDDSGYSFLDDEFENLFEVDLNTINRAFRVAMGLLSADTDLNEDYTFKDAAKYRTYLRELYSSDNDSYTFLYKDFGPIYVEESISLNGGSATSVEHNSSSDGNDRLNRLSADYLLFQSSNADSIDIQLTADEDDDVVMDIILFNTTTNTAEVKSDSSDHIIRIDNPDQYEYKIIVITRNDDVFNGDVDATYKITAKKVEGSVTSVFDDLQKITLGPNPTSGLINIDYQANTVKNISIRDITGKLKGTYKAETFSTELVLDGAKGVYFITLDNGKTFKVIKN